MEQARVQAEGVYRTWADNVLVVFLVLAAQYESWSLPFGVLLGTPIALAGALVALWLRGFDTGVFSQIGLVMIIGLAAKNAILIVEFSKAEHERGAGRPTAPSAPDRGRAARARQRRPGRSTAMRPSIHRGVAAAMMAVLVTGCAVGPDYARPPLTALKTLIREALASEYDLRIAAARVQQARAQAGVARAAFFPSVGYDVNAQPYKALGGGGNTREPQALPEPAKPS